MASSANNSNKLKKVIADRGLTNVDILACINRHVHALFDDSHSRTTAAANLRKEFSREALSDKALVKALTILGLSSSEIQKVQRGE